jgi:hypothetical protein
LVRLVIVRTIIIIVPFLMLLLLLTLPIWVPAFDLATCFYSVNDVV